MLERHVRRPGRPLAYFFLLAGALLVLVGSVATVEAVAAERSAALAPSG